MNGAVIDLGNSINLRECLNNSKTLQHLAEMEARYWMHCEK